MGFERRDYTGFQPHGGWTLVEFVRMSGNYSAIWRCRCVCGLVEEKRANDVMSGKSRSCGCLNGRHRHGESVRGKKSTEYLHWQTMKSRGGMVPEWEDFRVFLAHVGRKPASKPGIDRLAPDAYYLARYDKTKPFGPGNAGWKRRNDPKYGVLRMAKYKGETKPIKVWADIIGVDPATIWHHIRRKGVSENEAVKFYMKKFGG